MYVSIYNSSTPFPSSTKEYINYHSNASTFKTREWRWFIGKAKERRAQTRLRRIFDVYDTKHGLKQGVLYFDERERVEMYLVLLLGLGSLKELLDELLLVSRAGLDRGGGGLRSLGTHADRNAGKSVRANEANGNLNLQRLYHNCL